MKVQISIDLNSVMSQEDQIDHDAVFDDDALFGTVHTDKHNAPDFQFGTVNHFSNYVEEKTGLSQILVNLIVAGVVAYA